VRLGRRLLGIDAKKIFGRESVDNTSGPASLILTEQGRRVGSLGPGLTSDSADAVRAVLRDDLSAGPQVFMAPASGAGLICPAWTRGRGSQVRRASGCVPSLNLRKGWLQPS
jgi:hypothetical protein